MINLAYLIIGQLGSHLIILGTYFTIGLFPIQSNRCHQFLAWSSTSSYLALLGTDHELTVYRLSDTLNLVLSFPEVTQIQWQPLTDKIGILFAENSLWLHDFEKSRQYAIFKHSVVQFAWSQAGNRVVIIVEEGETTSKIEVGEGFGMLSHAEYRAILILDAEYVSQSEIPINAIWNDIFNLSWINENTLISNCGRIVGFGFAQYYCLWDLIDHQLKYEVGVSGGSSWSGKLSVDSLGHFVAIPIYWRLGFTKILNLESGELVTSIENTVFAWKPNSTELIFIDHDSVINMLDLPTNLAD